MNRKEITKICIKRLSFRKPLYKIPVDDDSPEDTVSTVINSEALSPNICRRTSGLKNFSEATMSQKKLLSPRTPFGPKTKACIIPSKDLSDQFQYLEMDVLENYNIWSDVGRGSFALVKLATHKTTMQKCAIKIYSKKNLEDPSLRKNVTREIKVLKKIDHPNIVKFYEEISSKNNLYIVMEYVRGISLNNHLTTKGLKRLDEVEAYEIFSQLNSALQYCHANNITHRDIKLENIQLDLEFNVKLIDFGFATCFSNSKKTLVYCGSPSYMAPEIINKLNTSGPPIDMWAAGVVLYLLVVGAFPFKSNTEPKVFHKIKQGTYTTPDHVSRSCKDLIANLLNQNPEKRFTASQVAGHPWMISSGGLSDYTLPIAGDNIDFNEDDI